MATNNEIFIKENTRTSHKRWESMVVYALHYALRDILIESQFAVGSYLIDAYMPSLKIAVEIDEEHHNIGNIKEKDTIRQRYIVEKLGCEFYRIDVEKGIYDQVDNIVQEIKSRNPEKWHYQIPVGKEHTHKMERGLANAETYEFVNLLRKEVDELGLKTSVDENTNGSKISTEGNGELGFDVSMDGIEFGIFVRKSNKPRVLVLDFAQGIPEALGLELEKKKGGVYYSIVGFINSMNNIKSSLSLKKCQIG